MTKLQNDSLIAVINLLAQLTVFGELDFPQFLKQLITIITTIVTVDSCLIYFYDNSSKKLILVGSNIGHDEVLGTITMNTGEGITGWVAEHKKMVFISEKAYEDERFKFFAQLPEDKFESFLSVPILSETGVVGVMNLQNKKPVIFSKDQMKTIESLGKIIASGFAKIMVDRKISSLQTQLDERKVVEKAKGILMKVKHITEEQAFKFIRTEAMNKRKSMKDIADAVILLWQ